MIKRALVSVSNKTGIVDFAKNLQDKKIEILSTGGTAKLLRENGVEAIDVSDYTGQPEIMNGRVKTLHPKIYGGLLTLRDNKNHIKEAEKNGIKMIDLAVVNFYPFAETIAKNGVNLKEVVERIDIGGPTLLRAAAKNFVDVTAVCDFNDYEYVWNEIKKNGDTTEKTRRGLAEKAFALIAEYDSIIANYLSAGKFKNIILEKIVDLRYGENPHQDACFYKDKNDTGRCSIVDVKQFQGKELSYNNIMDADSALSLVREFSDPAVVFAKHANPCGVAVANDIDEAFVRAHEGDVKSSFGGIIAMNRIYTEKLAQKTVDKFFEVVIAPDFDPKALKIFKTKPKLRVLGVGKIEPEIKVETCRKVSGGLLIQDLNTKQILEQDLKIVTKRRPTRREIQDMLFAWKVIKHVKSNSIVLAKNNMAVGIGAGQQSRVDAVELAIKKSLGRQKGSVMASDAFFPFPDSIEIAAKAGVIAVIQPGGSIKDAEVINTADDFKISMVFTGARAFLH